MIEGYFKNTKCWLCVGQSWINGTVCHECNPKAEIDHSAVKSLKSNCKCFQVSGKKLMAGS